MKVDVWGVGQGFGDGDVGCRRVRRVRRRNLRGGNEVGVCILLYDGLVGR